MSNSTHTSSNLAWVRVVMMQMIEEIFRCDSISRLGVWEWVSEWERIIKLFSVCNHSKMLSYLLDVWSCFKINHQYKAYLNRLSLIVLGLQMLIKTKCVLWCGVSVFIACVKMYFIVCDKHRCVFSYHQQLFQTMVKTDQ